MRQVHHSTFRRMVCFAQERVAEILRRNQDPIGPELVDLAAQHLNAPRRVIHREDDDRFVMPQLRAFA